MKNLNILLIFLSALAWSCASPKVATAYRDGTSPEKAIIVKNIGQEYEWVRSHHPGSRVTGQALLRVKRKFYDRLDVITQEDSTISVYFDINAFYGKGF